MPTTHYDLLGTSRPDASHDEIRAAYRALARRHHPDTQPGAEGGTDERAPCTMAALNAAWAVLGDPVRRRAYDAELGRPSAIPPPPTGNGNRPDWDWTPLHEGPDDPEDLDDAPYGDPPPRRPGDSMVMTPVLLVLLAVGLFFFSTLVQSPGLRTTAILLLPIAGFGFVAAPLFVILRGRSRDPSERAEAPVSGRCSTAPGSGEGLVLRGPQGVGEAGDRQQGQQGGDRGRPPSRPARP